MKAQRLRFRYRITEAGCSLGQREIIRAWEQAVTDAGLELAHSEGKRKTAQVSVAAPLPQNVTSDGELAEVYLSQAVPPQMALKAVSAKMPPGMELLAVDEVGVQAPSLQSQLRWAEYVVNLPPGADQSQVRRAVEELLAKDTLPSEYRREEKVRAYDLRPLVLQLCVERGDPGRPVLRMRLRAEPENTGRADQVLLALGLPEGSRIHRTRLQVEEVQPAVLAYRRSGEGED
ncbi:MAG TPA: TIGR03936 family radical SAM-associated protein [Dehalococcoidia bacterium]|nr:TIGR03936 family radical SAM-associated protein [Dehalococcoidia bacterium]